MDQWRVITQLTSWCNGHLWKSLGEPELMQGLNTSFFCCGHPCSPNSTIILCPLCLLMPQRGLSLYPDSPRLQQQAHYKDAYGWGPQGAGGCGTHMWVHSSVLHAIFILWIIFHAYDLLTHLIREILIGRVSVSFTCPVTRSKCPVNGWRINKENFLWLALAGLHQTLEAGGKSVYPKIKLIAVEPVIWLAWERSVVKTEGIAMEPMAWM